MVVTDLIDPALLQANRFGVHILTTLPDKPARQAILRIFLRDLPWDRQTTLREVLDTVAANTDGFSGAKLESLCNRVKMMALRQGDYEKPVPLKLQHFTETLEQVKLGKGRE